jgi:hypothetical protein
MRSSGRISGLPRQRKPESVVDVLFEVEQRHLVIVFENQRRDSLLDCPKLGRNP